MSYEIGYWDNAPGVPDEVVNAKVPIHEMESE